MELSFPGNGKIGQKQVSRLGIRNSVVDIIKPQWLLGTYAEILGRKGHI